MSSQSCDLASQAAGLRSVPLMFAGVGPSLAERGNAHCVGDDVTVAHRAVRGQC